MGDPKSSLKNQVSDVIGRQITSNHEWLPQNVIGKSGLRPFESSSNKNDGGSKVSANYSREGITDTVPFTSVPNNIVVDNDVSDNEWEVRFYFKIIFQIIYKISTS